MNETIQLQDKSISVWIVEDNRLYRENLAKVVTDFPWVSQCQAFETGERVVEAFQQESPPDVLLLDIGLPGIDGVTVLKKIKRISPITKVLILTIQEDKESVFHAISSGADGYLLKATSIDSIIQSIGDVLHGGSPINPYIASKILTAFKDGAIADSENRLTPREKEILELLVQGITRKKIASVLFVTYHTVDFHIRNIYSKLQVNTLSDAVAKAVKDKLL